MLIVYIIFNRTLQHFVHTSLMILLFMTDYIVYLLKVLQKILSKLHIDILPEDYITNEPFKIHKCSKRGKENNLPRVCFPYLARKNIILKVYIKSVNCNILIISLSLSFSL